MSFSNSPIEFTKCVMIEGYQNEPLIKEGQWFTMKCKRLFDSLVLSKLSNKMKASVKDCPGFTFLLSILFKVTLSFKYLALKSKNTSISW